MRIVKEGALAMQALAGLPDSLTEKCWQHAALMQGLTMPRRRHHESHRRITPWQAFTKQQPRWKDKGPCNGYDVLGVSRARDETSVGFGGTT
jgi:hypothetical protein